MPVSGLVIVMTPRAVDDGTADALLASMRAYSTLTIGEGEHDRVPVVLETDTSDESRVMIDRLRTAPGVAAVEIAYVDFADALVPGRNGDGG